MLYVLKVTFMVMGTAGGYYAIRSFHISLFTSLVQIVTILCLCIEYTVVFRGAYQMSSESLDVKYKLSMLSLGGAGSCSRTIAKFVKSLPTLCVKVGDFHIVERESALLFPDFLVQQIVGLLVSFP